MLRPLLSLALTVERHYDGRYYWAILESFDHSDQFEPLLEAAQGFSTYIEALQMGTAALVNLSDDPTVGPLEDGSEELDDDAQGAITRPIG